MIAFALLAVGSVLYAILRVELHTRRLRSAMARVPDDGVLDDGSLLVPFRSPPTKE